MDPLKTKQPAKGKVIVRKQWKEMRKVEEGKETRSSTWNHNPRGPVGGEVVTVLL